MYQPEKLNSLIIQAQMNGHKAIAQKLLAVQTEMNIANHIEASPDYVKLSWRTKCNSVLSLEDLGI